LKKLFGSLFVILMIGAVIAPAAAFAAPTFSYHVDDDGANDEPGQKDLTAQSSAQDPVTGDFHTSWKWDELSFSGKNTGDGCSLFDTDNDSPDRFVNYALCATVGGGQGAASASLLTVSLYSCTADNRVDRCSGPTLVFAAAGAAAATYCTVADGTGSFPVGNPDTDTVISCDITAIGAASTPPITVVGSGTLVNTCSYPSREPNSDPSDCVIRIPATDTGLSTTPDSTATWSADLDDTATVDPVAPGNVVFNLYLDDPLTTGACNAAELVFTDATNATDANGDAGTTTNVTVAGTYNWTADFTPTDPDLFNPSSSPCGSETVVVTAATATP
jgi:hypothetical protein